MKYDSEYNSDSMSSEYISDSMDSIVDFTRYECTSTVRGEGGGEVVTLDGLSNSGGQE